jgi:AcrR family transcriptional regulator
MFSSDSAKKGRDSKLVKKTASTPARAPQKRALLTRAALLRTARAVFARDGFELARIEDIARRAGKTRGAFYAHFKNKEDVFFAIFEDYLEEKEGELSAVTRHLPTLAERVTAICQHVAHSPRSRETMLLQIEFKAYAVRHPRRRKRLAALHTSMLRNHVLKELIEFVPQLEDRACSLAVSGALEGLTLNHMFDPDELNVDQLARLTELVLNDEIQRVQAL